MNKQRRQAQDRALRDRAERWASLTEQDEPSNRNHDDEPEEATGSRCRDEYNPPSNSYDNSDPRDD